MEPLVTFESAFSELKSCKLLKDTLAVILTLGNILNGGNKTRGQADGFAIEGMSKIVSIKDANNKSGMEYVCRKLQEIDPEYSNFKKTIRGVYDARRNNLPEIKGLFATFMSQTGAVKNK
jgi:hypothetical protein